VGICSFLKTVMLKPRAKALLPSKTSKRHSVFVMYISIYSIYIHIIIMYTNLRWNCSSKTTGRHPCALKQAQSLLVLHTLRGSGGSSSMEEAKVRWRNGAVKVDGSLPKGGLGYGGHDKPIHWSCAIYFPGGYFHPFLLRTCLYLVYLHAAV